MTMDDAYATCVIGYHLARLVGEDKVKEIVTEGEWDDPAVLQMAQDIEELASNGYYSEMVGSNVVAQVRTQSLHLEQLQCI